MSTHTQVSRCSMGAVVGVVIAARVAKRSCLLLLSLPESWARSLRLPVDHMVDSIAQITPRMKRHAEYESFGQCIYCSATLAKGPLSDEHIIPEMIGGRLVIDDASCNECARQTHAFEGHACDIYRPIRRQLNFPSKLKGRKDRERRKQESFVLLVDGRRVKVSTDEFPALMCSLVFPLPTILTGAPPSQPCPVACRV